MLDHGLRARARMRARAVFQNGQNISMGSFRVGHKNVVTTAFVDKN